LASERDDGQILRRVDLAVFVRGAIAVKAARALLANAHWESACGPARELFELLVNMEHVARGPDPDAEVFRWAKYGVLQRVRRQIREIDYARSTGRTVDEVRAQALAEALEKGFPEFATEKNGRLRFARSWTGLTTKDLADRSPNPLRAAQYEQLNSVWSEEIHATPAALLDAVFPDDGGEDWVRRAVDDDVESAQVATMTVTLFLELVRAPPLAPAFDARREPEWTRSLKEEAVRLGAAQEQ
jgi:hypothetical protein